MVTAARRERAALCDLFLDIGPDAPTLCGDWTTRDLAAHLVVRERRPDGALGIVAKPLAGYAEKVRCDSAGRDYDELVADVRRGPPWWSPMAIPAVDRLVNTIEFFVHHEDVRRAQSSWAMRALEPELEDDLWAAFRRGAPLLARRVPLGVLLRPAGRPELAARTAEDGHGTVSVTGELGELVLFLYGRQAHSVVEVAGEPGDVEAVRSAAFGV